jgi:peptide-methionine (S)-S-oxide reductase
MKRYKNQNIIYLSVFSLLFSGACAGVVSRENPSGLNKNSEMEAKTGVLDSVYFGAGCFWCVDAIFRQVEGVLSVESGYAGGGIARPTYREVSSGLTGHAEVCRIVYDTSVVSFKVLLEVFWKTHDPTTLNRQGADVGTQYRSVIYFMNERQREEAEFYKEELNRSGIWKDPIVTFIEPFKNYYPAEEYHQDYFSRNPNAAYCQFVIVPKLEKYRKVFGR